MKKKIGVLLAGSGVYDGSEIHEATLTLYFLDRAGAEILCAAPNKDQLHVVDHQTSEEAGASRNVLVESARISRGSMLDLASLKASDIDGLILPGGFGAAKNLADYAVKGRDCSVDPEVQRIIREVVDAGKPLGAMCIAPVVVAAALKDSGVQPTLTIGSDAGTAADLVFFGANHQDTNVDDIAVDEANKIVSTPAYMLGPGISDIAKGIEKLVGQVLEWA